MSRAHSKSILPLKRYSIPVDEHCKFLAHYDITANESLSGIRPLGAYPDDPGCILFYDFSEEQEVAYDLSGNDNHGDIRLPLWSGGIKGKAIQFDGTSNSYIQLPIGEGLNPYNQSYTFSIWVKPDSTTNNRMIFGADIGSNQRLYIGKHSGRWRLGIQGSSWGSSGTLSVTTDLTHLCLVMDKGEARLYVNGQLGDTKSYTSYTLASNFRIGTGDIDVSYRFDGSVPMFSMYNRALSLDEINQIHNLYIATLRHDGIYGGCIAIEESTENLSVNPCFSDGTYTGWSGDGTIIEDGLFSPYAALLEGRDGPATHVVNTTVYPPGTYKVSIWYKHLEGQVPYLNANGASGSVSDAYPFRVGPGWQVAKVTYTTTSDSRFYAIRYASGSPTAHLVGKTIIGAIQVETGNNHTSFVNGSRVMGKLGYPPGHINWTQPWTISMWVKLHSTMSSGGGNEVLWGAGTNGVNLGLHLLRRANGQLALGFGGNDLNTSAYTDDAEWHHYAFVWDGSKQYIYEDGKQIASRTANGALNQFVNTVPHGPNMYDLGNRPSNALIDEVRIDQIARSPEEIYAWYISSAPFYPKGVHRIIS